MIVNYRKLNKQIRAVDGGYRFYPEKGQDELYGIVKKGSKRSFMKCMVYFVREERDFHNEFVIK